MKHLTCLLLLSLLLASCSGESDQSLKEKELELKERELDLKEKELDLANKDSKPEKVGYEFTPNASIAKSSTDIVHQGNVIKEVTWKDENGENLAVFTENESKLWVYHYAFQGKHENLVRKVHDFEKDCPFDLSIGFIDRSIKITDLDNDNIGELTFAYRKACRSDVSPMTLKLLTLEGGEKYIIRGTTLLNFGDESYGGEKIIDPSFENGPKSFLNHANKVWSDVVKERVGS